MIYAKLLDSKENDSSQPDPNGSPSDSIRLHVDPERLVIDRSRSVGSIAVAVLMASSVFLAGCGSEQELQREDYTNIQSKHEGNLP